MGESLIWLTRWGDPDFCWFTFSTEWGLELDENSAGLSDLLGAHAWGIPVFLIHIQEAQSASLFSGSSIPACLSHSARCFCFFFFSPGVLSLSLAFDKIWSRLPSAARRLDEPGVLCVDILSLRWVPRSRLRWKGSSRKSHSAPSPSYVLQHDRLEVLYLEQHIWYYILSLICLLVFTYRIVRM